MPLLNHSLCCHVACRGNRQTAVPFLKNIFEMRSGMNFTLGTGGDMAGLRPLRAQGMVSATEVSWHNVELFRIDLTDLPPSRGFPYGTYTPA